MTARIQLLTVDPGAAIMIVEYVRYTIPADRREAFEGGYEDAARPLAASPHCLAYELARCADDPTQYVLRIEWDSADGHMQGFRRSAEFRTFFAAIRPFVGDIVEMRHYEQTAIRGRGNGAAAAVGDAIHPATDG